MVVIAAVDPGTNTLTTPAWVSDCSITCAMPSVRSTTSPSPCVLNLSSPL